MKKKTLNLCYHCGRKLMGNKKKYSIQIKTPQGEKEVFVHKICKEQPDDVVTDWDEVEK